MPLWAQEADSVRQVDISRMLEGKIECPVYNPEYILIRVARSGAESERLLSLAWNNPAIKQLWRDYKLSEVSVHYNSRSEMLKPT